MIKIFKYKEHDISAITKFLDQYLLRYEINIVDRIEINNLYPYISIDNKIVHFYGKSDDNIFDDIQKVLNLNGKNIERTVYDIAIIGIDLFSIFLLDFALRHNNRCIILGTDFDNELERANIYFRELSNILVNKDKKYFDIKEGEYNNNFSYLDSAHIFKFNNFFSKKLFISQNRKIQIYNCMKSEYIYNEITKYIDKVNGIIDKHNLNNLNENILEKNNINIAGKQFCAISDYGYIKKIIRDENLDPYVDFIEVNDIKNIKINDTGGISVGTTEGRIRKYNLAYINIMYKGDFQEINGLEKSDNNSVITNQKYMSSIDNLYVYSFSKPNNDFDKDFVLDTYIKAGDVGFKMLF